MRGGVRCERRQNDGHLPGIQLDGECHAGNGQDGTEKVSERRIRNL